MDLTVHHIGVYRHHEHGTYFQATPCISLLVSGFHSFKVQGIEVHDPGPFIYIHPGEQYIKLHSTHQRENWAILFSTPHLHQALQPDHVEWLCRGKWVPIPKCTPVPIELVPGWRSELALMRDAFLSALPQDVLRIETGISNLLRFVLDQQNQQSVQTNPAWHLRRLIDEDGHSLQTLEALSETCGYSSDHLRLLFLQEFGVTPSEYRLRRRMARAMELITSSQLTIKAIADALGFNHASHFSMAFRQAFQLTPREAIRRFRH